MSNLVQAAPKSGGLKSNVSTQNYDQNQFVTVLIGGQLFGIPVLDVHDVLGPQRITRIPLAPPEVAGSLNLRGRIVTALDIRLRLGLPPRGAEETSMSTVVEYRGEFYSLMVDSVGEVLTLDPKDFLRSPATLDPRWRESAIGVYRLESELLVVLDVARILDIGHHTVAA
ncbi:MAG: chemotaxis protein CheW [Alphaproteobacteria bacterium]|nr:chemotaxis protein CheW [Alphaproteobacteria bacterium]